MTLEKVDRFEVPQQIISETEQTLESCGQEGFESFVLWSGVIDAEVFMVRNAHVPRQTSYRTDEGLLVRVDGQALHELNVWLFEHTEVLGVQVHAHPTRAFHSPTDDKYPIVTTLGGLSIVAADFAQGGLLDKRCAAYRLTVDGWRPIKKPWRSPLLVVVA